MDGWAELYYRTENDYKAKENKVLPYSVNCGEHKNIGVLVNILKDAGFSYVVTTTGAPSLMTSFLVNLKFRKLTITIGSFSSSSSIFITSRKEVM